MALNLNKLKNKVENKDTKSNENNEENIWWKPSTISEDPEVGRQVARLLPIGDEGDFAHDLAIHFNIPGKNHGILCPYTMFGEPCEICNLATATWNDYKETKQDAAKSFAKKLFRQNHHVVPVLLRSEDDKSPDTVRLWRMSDNQYNQVVKLMIDPADGLGDVTDPEEGCDIMITKYPKGATGNDTKFTKYEITVPRSFKQGPIFSGKGGKKRQEDLLNALPDVMAEIRSTYEVEDMKALIDTAFSDDPDDSKGSEYGTGKETSEEDELDAELKRLKAQTEE